MGTWSTAIPEQHPIFPGSWGQRRFYFPLFCLSLPSGVGHGRLISLWPLIGPRALMLSGLTATRLQFLPNHPGLCEPCPRPLHAVPAASQQDARRLKWTKASLLTQGTCRILRSSGLGTDPRHCALDESEVSASPTGLPCHQPGHSCAFPLPRRGHPPARLPLPNLGAP